MKLLLVEDEEDLNKLVARGLKKSGYAVDSAFTGNDALYMYSVNEYDLIILDLNLPGVDGIDVLKQIRQGDLKTKVLILSARGKVEEKVCGLDSGANDYLVKPFDFIELEARVRNLLRVSFAQNPAVLECGCLSVDTLAKKVTGQSGEKIELTKKEYSILEYLMINQGKVISAEELIEHVWDSEVDLFSNSLKYHIHSLKKKIKSSCGGMEYIRNIRLQGYCIEGGGNIDS